MFRLLSKTLKNIYLVLGIIILFTTIYIKKSFGSLPLEQFLYTLQTSEGTSLSAVREGVIFVAIRTIIVVVILKVMVYLLRKIKVKYNFIVFFKNRPFKFRIFPLSNFQRRFGSVLIFLSSIYFCYCYLDVSGYIKLQSEVSTIFEDYYVDPKKVNITSPSEKKNLIYIYVESLEMTGASIDNGGILSTTFFPNLEEIALKNTNFSNHSNLGGAYVSEGAGWTAGALVTQTSGVPLKVSIDGNSYSGYSGFLPGVYSLGEVLADNGYKNYFMLGSKIEFGGRKDYFESHGNYTILDYNWAKETKKIDSDYYVWWGYEDSKLYDFAKEELLNIASQDEPFNFTMLTADTHFTDGYLDESCPSLFDSAYANSFYCTDLMLSSFISWIQEQDFYDDTVIIITGDHLTMQSNFYEEVDGYDRVVYNTIINSDAVIELGSKNRNFMTFDMYPTTIGALNFEIDGDRLGLGTNLYSNRKTLAEEFGIEAVNEELRKQSNYYDHYLLKDSYFEMEDKLTSEEE